MLTVPTLLAVSPVPVNLATLAMLPTKDVQTMMSVYMVSNFGNTVSTANFVFYPEILNSDTELAIVMLPIKDVQTMMSVDIVSSFGNTVLQ